MNQNSAAAEQFIAGLSDDELMAVLTGLVKRIWSRSDSTVPIPIRGESERDLGYVILNDDSMEAQLACASYRIANPGRMLDTEEFIALLRQKSKQQESAVTGS